MLLVGDQPMPVSDTTSLMPLPLTRSIVCFIIYILANIGLALQNSYAALFVLRCFQSTGSSATIAMCSAVVSDVSTPAERGKYMGFTLAGSLLGPAIGPVIGGVLAQFLGWRAIFWFLMIMGSAFLVTMVIFFPETARSQVGNGSIPPKGWNMSLINYLAIRKARKLHADEQQSQVDAQSTASLKPRKKLRFPNPLKSLYIMYDKENALLLFYNAFLFASFYDVTAVLPSQLEKNYGYNELQIGLCFIPFGFGSLCAALTNGQLLDRNFARWAKRLGMQVKKGRNQDLSNFPIEKVRLQIALPAVYVTCTMVCIFGWILDVNGPVPALLVVLFFTSFSMSIAFNVTSTLLVDFYPKAPATATAANNLARCGIGAGATAAVIPMVNAMGRGWTFTFLILFLIATSPMLWAVYFWGMKWRGERNERERISQEKKDAAKSEQSHGEEGITPTIGEKPPVEGNIPELAAMVGKEQEVNHEIRKLASRSKDEVSAGSKANVGQDVTLSRTLSYESSYP
jgi:MFS family permease